MTIALLALHTFHLCLSLSARRFRIRNHLWSFQPFPRFRNFRFSLFPTSIKLNFSLYVQCIEIQENWTSRSQKSENTKVKTQKTNLTKVPKPKVKVEKCQKSKVPVAKVKSQNYEAVEALKDRAWTMLPISPCPPSPPLSCAASTDDEEDETKDIMQSQPNQQEDKAVEVKEAVDDP